MARIRDFFLNCWAQFLVLQSRGSGGLDASRVFGFIEVLRSALRRYPTWRDGHIRLARYAITCENLPLAQSSVLAAQALGSEDDDHRTSGELAFVRGILALRLGYPERAIAILTPLVDFHPEVKEELAAAYAATGDREKALSILKSIPIQELSAAARVTMEFLDSGH